VEVFSVDIPLANNLSDGFKSGPLVFSRKPVDIANGKTLLVFDAPMIAIDGIERLAATNGIILKKQIDVLIEALLVFFDLNDLVGLFLDNGVGDFFWQPMASMVTMAPFRESGLSGRRSFEILWELAMRRAARRCREREYRWAAPGII
jgi:hypothetical protein